MGSRQQGGCGSEKYQLHVLASGDGGGTDKSVGSKPSSAGAWASEELEYPEILGLGSRSYSLHTQFLHLGSLPGEFPFLDACLNFLLKDFLKSMTLSILKTASDRKGA